MSAGKLVMIGVATTVLFSVVVLVEGARRLGYDPRYHTGSELELGPGGWIQRGNFLLMGAGMFACAVGVYQTLGTFVVGTALARAHRLSVGPSVLFAGRRLVLLLPYPAMPKPATRRGIRNQLAARWLLVAALAIAAIGQQACGPLRAPAGSPTPEQPGVLERAGRITELYASGHTNQAMELLRQEIASPSVDHQKWTAAMRLTALELLADLVELRGLDPELIEEAERYRAEGERAVRGHAEYLSGSVAEEGAASLYEKTAAAQLEYAWGVFQLRAGRPDEALESFRRVQAAWQAGAEVHPADEIRIVAEMAGAHHALGHFELAASLDESALEQTRRFVASPPEYAYRYLYVWRGLRDNHWVAPHFGRMLARCGRACAPERRKSLWVAQLNALRARDASPLLSACARASYASALLRGGAVAEAREVFGGVHGYAAVVGAHGADRDRARLIDVTEAKLAVAEERPERAVALLGPMVEEAERKAAHVDPSIRAALGLALEQKGDVTASIRHYRASVDALEQARRMLAVRDRRSFFGAERRLPYWGLVRALTRQAAKTGQRDAFFAALQASELIRSRQLGEVLAQRGFEVEPASDLDAILASVDHDEAWLDFVVTDRGTVLLGLTRDGFRAAVVPLSDHELVRRVEQIRGGILAERSRTDPSTRELAELSRDLLEPLKDLLAGKKRWVVLPDGPLAALPFELFKLQAGGFVVDHVEVSIAPSISLLRAKATAGAAKEGLFAVGDPHFGSDDALSAAERKASGRGLSPLPETRSEVARIAALFPKDAVTTRLGERATESGVRSDDLRGYRVLHFATHGLLAGQLPQLGEPALAMAREADENGFLTASEVERLDLSAEVVVLSACDTGRGEYVAGEGVLGLGRAFLVAGARSVVVSLWPVDSIATEELMVAFYQHLRKDVRPSEALRRAKLDMRAGKLVRAGGRRALTLEGAPSESAATRAPYYWVGFTVLSR